MARYQLRHPVRAAQFDGANAGEVFDLINLGGGGSMMSDRKQLKAYFADEAQLNDSLSKMKDRYAYIQTPTVIITGDSDQIVDAKRNAHQLHQVMKRSRIIELANTGHEIPQTHPESIAQAVGIITTPTLAEILQKL